MNIDIALLPGDGVGPEVTSQAVKCLKAIADLYGHRFTFNEAPIGANAIALTGNPLPEETLQLCLKSNAILFGAIGDPKYDNDPKAKVRPEQGLLELRKSLGLYANIRPVQAYETLLDHSPLKKNTIKGTDLIIYRELTGGIYFGKKTLTKDGKEASDLCSYSYDEISRITHLAFKAAKSRRKRLTLVDKANVLETSRLWRSVVTEISKSYPDLSLEFLFVDNAAMQLILNPKQFDIILTENMFGDILSDEASVIGGSIGMLASASIGDKNALFEPIHGSYPQAKGKGIANPMASILSAAMLLDHLDLRDEAELIREGVNRCLKFGTVTPDLDPHTRYGTEAVGTMISDFLENYDGDLFLNQHNIDMGRSTII